MAAAMALSSLIANSLYGVHAADLATLAAVPVFILAVGALACAIPAWKAAKSTGNGATAHSLRVRRLRNQAATQRSGIRRALSGKSDDI